jgi:hypothetical protein
VDKSILNTFTEYAQNAMLRLVIIWILMAYAFASTGQESISALIHISGKAYDAETGYGLSGLMILNKRTKTGVFGNHSGEFSVNALKSDTLKFSVVGYSTITVCFADSVTKTEYSLKLNLQKLQRDLPELEVFPQRDLFEIKKDIDELGVKYDYKISGLGAVSSPISFLYERFSQNEKQKRLAAYLYNEEAKKDILKELFRKYVHADIIHLNEKEFDDFIGYCSFPEFFLKSATQYELAVAVRDRFIQFRGNKGSGQ